MVAHGEVIVITFHRNKWVMLKETPFKNHAHSNLVMVPKLFVSMIERLNFVAYLHLCRAGNMSAHVAPKQFENMTW
jgi:hypothetical protein